MPYIYPFDPNGVLASNLISNEVHVVTAPTAPDSANFIVPSFGPFFGNSLVVEQVNGSVITALVQGVDYQLGAQWFEMRSSFSQSVYAAISFMNLSFSGNVRITYQTVGGPYTDVDQSLLLNLTQSLYKLRNINWSQIVGPLVQFPVEPHNHSVVDVVANDVVLKLDEIAQAIQDNPSAAGALSDGSTIIGSGIIGNPLAVKLSTTAGNKLQSTPQGLYVPTTTVPALVTDTSTLSGTGVTGSPLAVKVTDISDNILEAASDGLYVPKSYFSVNDFTGDATQFNGIQIKIDDTSSNALPNALYKTPNGLYVFPEVFTKAWTSDIGITGSGYTNSKISLVRNPAPNNILQIDADGLFVPAPDSAEIPKASTTTYGLVAFATADEVNTATLDSSSIDPSLAITLTISDIAEMINYKVNKERMDRIENQTANQPKLYSHFSTYNSQTAANTNIFDYTIPIGTKFITFALNYGIHDPNYLESAKLTLYSFSTEWNTWEESKVWYPKGANLGSISDMCGLRADVGCRLVFDAIANSLMDPGINISRNFNMLMLRDVDTGYYFY